MPLPPAPPWHKQNIHFLKSPVENWPPPHRFVYFLTAMLSIINDETAKCDISDVRLDFWDLCRPLPLVIVINVLDTEVWHGDPYFDYHCF